jgi:D-arabinose 1-dehydrogenase-like Zn-dependent alcohol dehydrogenase
MPPGARKESLGPMPRLVIVDADRGLRRAARVIAEAIGWDVAEAATGEEAAEAARREGAQLAVWLSQADEKAVAAVRRTGAEVVAPVALSELIDLLRARRGP